MRTYIQANRPLALDTSLGEDVLVLTKVTGREELGRLFEFQLHMQSTQRDLPFSDIIGQNATIRMEGGTESGKTRYFNGFLHNFRLVQISDTIAFYQASFVPWLWFLTKTSDCRIFQNLTVPEILKQVFQDSGYNDFEDRLSASYSERTYCVQYRETAFDFVSRLMEEEGIYYYFKHEAGQHTLVLADSISSHDPTPAYESIIYKEYLDGDVGSEHIRSWQGQARLLTTAYTHRDFDFIKPHTDLTSTADMPRQHTASGLERFDYPGRFINSSEGDHLAKVRIDEIQADYQAYSGTADAKGLAAGALFQLENYIRSDQNQEYLIKSVTHTIEGDGLGNEAASERFFYECSFTAVKSSTPYRAARTTPKPTIDGLQTALVVGSSGEEIHVDEYGRVKVQFHWDRYGAYDDKSSCWLRVAQNSAGNQWGSMALPRVGHEVLVQFLEGDPDRPVISGNAYNGANAIPYALPANKTVSTLKTSTSKGGGGSNEIRFEDKKDSEQLFIHAQKDMDSIVEHDRKDWIKHDAHQHVGHDQFELIENDQHHQVKGEQRERVGGDDNLTVKGHHYVTLKGNRHLEVKGAAHTEIGGDHHLSISGNHNQASSKSVSIKGGMNVVVEAGLKLSLEVGGNFVDISPVGVAIKGTLVLINNGGAAGSVTAPQAPEAAEAPANVKDPEEVPGGKLAEGPEQKAAKRQKIKQGSTEVPAVQVMKNAAKDGTPFCEECEKAKQAQTS